MKPNDPRTQAISASGGQATAITMQRRRTAGSAFSFDRLCHLAGLNTPLGEYRFHPTRKWRFDWAFVSERLAVEVEGGIWVAGRHSRGLGFEKDLEKYAEAMVLGWRVLRVTPKQMANGEALTLCDRILRRAA